MVDTVKKYLDIINEALGINDDWFKKGAFKAYKKSDSREPFEIASDSGTLDTLEGPVTYAKGDYIITGPKGERYPISPEKFRELKTDNGDGTASPKKIVKLVKLADHNGEVVLKYNGSKLNYLKGEDYIVRHGADDYGVVKRDIFNQTYEQEKE
jgi:hypothetical protein